MNLYSLNIARKIITQIMTRLFNRKTAIMNICHLFIYGGLFLTNNAHAQVTCCNNDTIYFNNQVDCSICLEIDCFDPNTGGALPFSAVYIINDTPTTVPYALCPNPSCPNGQYISCGGPLSPQLGKIILTPNACELCPAIRFRVVQISTRVISPAVTVFSSSGPSTDVLNNSPCCPSSSTPNFELSFDCNTKTLTLKCI